MGQRPNGALKTILLLAGGLVMLFGTLWGITAANLNQKASIECAEAIRADVDDNTRDVRTCEQTMAAIGERLARMEANQERILRKLEE